MPPISIERTQRDATPAGADQGGGGRVTRTARGRAPRDGLPESSLAFALEGYRFGTRRFRATGGDVVEVRLALQRTLVLRGAEAARVLYDTRRFVRRGAMPGLLRKTLLGVGGVQGLDGEAHRARKAMFLSVLGPERAHELADEVRRCWHEALPRWERAREVVLLDEVAEVLCRAVCAWAGVPLPEHDVARRTRDLRSLIEEAGDPRLGYARARLGRRRAEAWCAGVVEQVRDGSLAAAEGSALHAVAGYREPGGDLLEPRVAAVELLNVLRPTVAVHRWVALAALALHEHPGWRTALRGSDDDVLPFVHEVRRYYPFFPVVAARVRRTFEWRGVRFPAGRRVLLDVTATDRDPAAWDDPDAFRPERFRSKDIGAFDLVPQGGGDHATGHRCAGEWVTIDIMATAVRALVRDMTYVVPPQDLRVSTTRMPTAPADGLVLRDVRARR